MNLILKFDKKIRWYYFDLCFIKIKQIDWSTYSIIQVIILVSDWLIFYSLSLNFGVIFIFNSLFVFFWYILLYFRVCFACDDVVRWNGLFDDILGSDVPVNFFWLIVIFKLLASFWRFVLVGNWVVPDTVCVTPVVSKDFVFVLYFLFIKLLLFTLLFPSFLITLHSFHQSRLIKMIFSISLIFSNNSVVDLMIFIEALLFWS